MRSMKVNSEDYDGRTPLHIAASHASIEIIRFLLENVSLRLLPIILLRVARCRCCCVAALPSALPVLRTAAHQWVHFVSQQTCNCHNSHESGTVYRRGSTARVWLICVCLTSYVMCMAIQGASVHSKDHFGHTPLRDAVLKHRTEVVAHTTSIL